MKYLHKYGTRSNEIRRAKKELFGRLGLAAAALFFLVLMYLFAQFQPGKGSSERTRAVTARDEGKEINSQPPSITSLQRQAQTLYTEYLSSLEDGSGELEKISLLEKAIDLQSQLVRLAGRGTSTRHETEFLDKMQAIRDETMGNSLLSESINAEKEAEAALEIGDRELAEESLQKAIDLQNKINEQYSRSPNSSASRMHLLARKLLHWQTQPIAAKADALRANALELVERGRYQEARTMIREALDRQRHLMQEYRASPYSDLNRMRTFEQAVIHIDIAEDADTVKRLIAQAEEALEQKKWVEALADTEKAEALQQGILEKVDAADEEQSSIMDSIIELKDTASSGPVFQRIETARENTRNALAQQNMELFQEKVAEWYRDSDFLARRFERSRFKNQISSDEVNLLYRLRAEIPSIHEMVINNIELVPGSENLQLFTTEVTQALYEGVTGVNPSTSRNFQYPVDSVTWEEAKAFTKMLGIILDRPVDLPDMDTYLAALGTVTPSNLRTHYWSSENSNRQVQKCGDRPPNINGFHDLLGNVAEWLDSASSGATKEVVAVGGSARDPASRLIDTPTDLRSATERNRFIGFRFVVHESISR